MAKKGEIKVKDVSIRTMKVNGADYIYGGTYAITDIAFKFANWVPLNQIAILQMRVQNGNEGRNLLK